MKPKALPIFLASLLFANSAGAASLTWDIAPGTVGTGDNAITGGTGIWNLGNGNWSPDAGANNVIWGNTSADEAIFGDVGGTVTINTGTGIIANKLTFNSTGYTISGNVVGDLLTLAGTTPTITVTSVGDTAAIGAGVAGSAGITKSGAGVLTLPSALTYTGSTIVADGALGVAAALPTTPGPGSNLVLSGGVFSPGTSFSRALGTAGNQVQIIGSGGFWANGANKTARFGTSTSTLMTWASTPFFLGDGATFLLNHEASGFKITFQQPISFNGAVRTVEVRNGTAAIDAELSGALQGSGDSGLLKTGAGTLALTAANTYTGTTTISGGSLYLGNGGAAGSLTATSAIVNDANLTINRNNDFTQATDLGAGVPITGTGSLTKAGTGSATLTVANTYSGGTSINGGTLVVAHASAINTSTNPIAISTTTGGGTLSLATDTSVDAFKIISSSSNAATIISDRATPGEGITHVLGEATLNRNTFTFAAGANVTSGTAGISLASVGLGAGFPGGTTVLNPTTATLTIAGGVGSTVNSYPKTLELGGTSTGNTIQGAVSNGNNVVSVSKSNTGTWSLTGANTYSGDTTVSGGTLSLGQVNPSNESSTISIISGAVLDLAFAGTDTVDKLFIDGVQQPAGLYTSAHSSGVFTGGGTLQVTAGPSGYSTWITGTFANGTVPGGQQGPNDDPDNDGVSNLVEYAIAGLDPTASNGAVGTFSGLTLTFTKRSPLATDISYIIETSPDLQNPWTARVTHGLGNTDPAISHTLPSGGGKLFARLRVSQ